jgi:hypothetical protein
MRRLLLIAMILFCFKTITSQENLSESVYSHALKHSSGIDLQNKIIVVNIWSTTNTESRNCNKAISKTMQMYQYAKLKGGTKGIVTFDICLDDLLNAAQIIRAKDEVTNSILLSNEQNLQLKESNFVFDSFGKLIFQNIPAASINESIHQLITR